MTKGTTTKLLEARELIPDALKEEFDKLVEDYKYHAFLRYGAPFVSYVILADLITSGWRRIEKYEELKHESRRS